MQNNPINYHRLLKRNEFKCIVVMNTHLTIDLSSLLFTSCTCIKKGHGVLIYLFKYGHFP